jgi:hypothetical protein
LPAGPGSRRDFGTVLMIARLVILVNLLEKRP